MVWITEIKATGEIFEMHDSPNPKGVDMSIALSNNAQNAGYALTDIIIREVTKEQYQSLRDADPLEIAAKAKEQDERPLKSRKVVLDILFEMANQIRVLEGKGPITRQQFIDNLKSRI